MEENKALKEIYDELINLPEEERLKLKIDILLRENSRLKEELQYAKEQLQYYQWQSVKGTYLI